MKLCFDVAISVLFLFKTKQAMEYTFRAVTHRPGILIWRIEVI